MPSEAGYQIYGIRHHGAGSARNLLRALELQKPTGILLECPADCQHLFPYVDQQLLKPPVAIMVYDKSNLNRYAYYPFASFSPEWVAMQYAADRNIPVTFFDLPQYFSFALKSKDQISKKVKNPVTDPFTIMAQLAGFDDTERWWEAYIEDQPTAPEIFQVILELMSEMRSTSPEISSSNLIREAFMRQQIRAKKKLGVDNMAVVCGAWHSPALTNLDKPTTSDDRKTLQSLRKVPTQSTWVPWSYHRIARHSGYESGVISPYWYEALFTKPDTAIFQWMSRASLMLKDWGIPVSPAHNIEASRLAQTLASLRAHSKPGITELFDAVTTVYCSGDRKLIDHLEKELLEGSKVGVVSDEIPTVPLKKDIEIQIKKARLGRDWKKQGVIKKKLDLRKNNHLLASRLLHQLLLLDIPWGEEQEIDHNPLGTFHEYWDLLWYPDYEIKIIEASMWGNTVAEAASNYVLNLIAAEDNFKSLGDLLYRILHAHLPHLVEPVSSKIRQVGNLSDDAHLLMMLIPPLIWSERYGDTAQLKTTAVTSLLQELIPRLCILFPSQAQNISEDRAQDLFHGMHQVHQSMQLTRKFPNQKNWLEALHNIIKNPLSHPLIKGGCLRILYLKNYLVEADLLKKLHYEVSNFSDSLSPAQFMEGFLSGAGWLLIHRPALYQVVDEWLTSQGDDQFEQTLPILRRTLSTFSDSEKQAIYQLIDKPGTVKLSFQPLDQRRQGIILSGMKPLLKT